MARHRKTKQEKIKASERREGGFTIRKEWLGDNKASQIDTKDIKVDKPYFRADLTKTFVLTMLILALELALWNYLSRQ